jgi:hypothetical protein
MVATAGVAAGAAATGAGAASGAGAAAAIGAGVAELALGEVAQALKAMAQAPRNNGERASVEKTEGVVSADFMERKVRVFRKVEYP